MLTGLMGLLGCEYSPRFHFCLLGLSFAILSRSGVEQGGHSGLLRGC
jgi:hypothetical protein